MTAELVTSYLPRGLAEAQGDTEFEKFYSRYLPCLIGYAWKLFGPADAEDIAQETLARAFANFDRLDPERDPWPWLCVVARRVGTDIVRSHARTVTVEDQRLQDLAVADSSTPLDHVQARDDRRALRRALAQLSPSDRRVLHLREYDDLSASDIAALLDCSETAVRQQLFRARRRLAERFRAVGGMGALLPVPIWRALRGAAQSRRAASRSLAGGAVASVMLLSAGGAVTLGLGGDQNGVRHGSPGARDAANAVHASAYGSPDQVLPRSAAAEPAAADLAVPMTPYRSDNASGYPGYVHSRDPKDGPPPGIDPPKFSGPPAGKGSQQSHSVSVDVLGIAKVSWERHGEMDPAYGPVCQLPVVDCG